MEKERLNNFEDVPFVREEAPQQKETVVKESGLEEKKTGREVQHTKIGKIVKQSWFQVVFDAKHEFSEDAQTIIDKLLTGGYVSPSEQSRFAVALNLWWKEQFGFYFTDKKKRNKFFYPRKTLKEELGISKKGVNYESAKENRMRRLHAALRQLDADEPIGEFEYVTRRKIFYDKHKKGFVLNDNEEAGVLTLGDMLSDYAWDIRYAPDFGRMQDAPHEARRIAKRILVNEARRDLETIYNQELTARQPGASGVQNIQRMFYKIQLNSAEIGPVAEVMARETLARIAVDHNLGFAVLRANTVEDGLYKYDFKILAKEHRRGVEVEDEENFEKRLKSLGIQFTKGIQHKLHMILEAKQKYGTEIPVDDIVLIKIHSDEFHNSFNLWMRLGKPSGGPEQFLSPELKTDLLQRATQGIVTIKQEALEHLFEKPNRKNE